MNAKELISKIVVLEQELVKKKNEVLVEYCKANNPYKVGDTFTDHIGTIKIEVIRYHLSYDYDRSCCTYFGIELKKDGTPKKTGVKRTAYQSNDIKRFK